MASTDTRERILDAAERLFADRGFAATSLRTIISEARVNLAAIHYHFGSKDRLIGAVFARRFAPVTAERLRRLDALEEAAGGKPVAVEALLEAFIRPAMGLFQDGSGTRQPLISLLVGRLHSEPEVNIRRLLYEAFRETTTRFVDAFARALPDLPIDEVYTRFHFLIGTMAASFTDPQRLDFISSGRVDAHDLETIVRRLITFLSAALRAPKTDAEAVVAASADETKGPSSEQRSAQTSSDRLRSAAPAATGKPEGKP